ncbi:unnamed protein product [Heterobilharzia americana]|nr:unnamed protein product [Heterobilharzia americana]
MRYCFAFLGFPSRCKNTVPLYSVWKCPLHVRLHQFAVVRIRINLLLDSLKRDCSFSISELSNFIKTKSKQSSSGNGNSNINNIQFSTSKFHWFLDQRIISCLMDVDENDLKGPEVPEIKPEGSLDILLQTTRHCSTEYYNYCIALSEVLQNTSMWEVEDCRRINNRDPDPIYLPYAQIYRFLSALFHGQPLPNMSDLSSGAFLDLLTCLVHILRMVKNKNKRVNQGDSAQNSFDIDMAEKIKRATEMVIEKMGIFLALASAARFNSYFYTRRQYISQEYNEHPVAPLHLLSKVEHPTSLKQTHFLVQHLITKFKEVWLLPSASQLLSSEDIKSNGVPESLSKRLSMFALNPLSLPIEVISPFQKILDDFRQSCLSRFPLLSCFKSVLCNSLPLEIVSAVEPPIPTSETDCSQAKRRCIKKSSNKTQSEKHRTIREKIISMKDSLSVDASTYKKDNQVQSDKGTSSGIQLTSRNFVKWCPGTHFIRVSDPEEDASVKMFLNKRYKVKIVKKEKIDQTI